MSEPEDVARALADQIRNRIARDFNVAAWPFSHMSLPRIEVWTADDFMNPYDETDSDDGITRMHWLLRVDIATQDPETAFMQIMDLLGNDTPSSLRAAVMYDRTLGGVVDDTWVPAEVRRENDEANEAQTAWVPVDTLVTKG